MGDVDGSIGAWGLARGGMGAISNALASACREHGGEIRTNAGVHQVRVKFVRASKGISWLFGLSCLRLMAIDSLRATRPGLCTSGM